MRISNLDKDQLGQKFLLLSSYSLVQQADHLLFRQRQDCGYPKQFQSKAFGWDEYIKYVFIT